LNFLWTLLLVQGELGHMADQRKDDHSANVPGTRRLVDDIYHKLGPLYFSICGSLHHICPCTSSPTLTWHHTGAFLKTQITFFVWIVPHKKMCVHRDLFCDLCLCVILKCKCAFAKLYSVLQYPRHPKMQMYLVVSYGLIHVFFLSPCRPLAVASS
jgi:hypothetical protein